MQQTSASQSEQQGNHRQVEIKTLTPNVYVDGTFAILNPQIGTTRSGKPFLKCLIRDATGECPARQWTVDEDAVRDIGATGFVWIAGHSQDYNGQVQIIIEQIRSVEVSVHELRALLPCTKFDVDEMFAEVRRILSTLDHPAMRTLAETYLDDAMLMARFRESPAAASLHHAWIGGLLEHTLNLMKLAEATLPRYPELNRDIVLMGLFLHDLAKTSELTWERGFGYTTQGNLIGHVVTGTLWLEEKVREVAERGGPILPARAHLVLSHIILSHHSEPEFGAVKRPSTPEAVFVALLDNLDAKTSMSLQHARQSGPDFDEGLFTDKVWALGGARMFKPDPLPTSAHDDE